MKWLKTILIAGLILSPSFALAQSSSLWKFTSSLLQPVVSTWNVYAPADFRFDGDLLPDGADCAAGEILKKVGANDWDCAADAGGSDPFTHPSAGVSATTSEIRSSTSSSTDLRVSGSVTLEYLATGLLKVTNGVVGLASAGSDYLTTAITSLGGQTGGTQTLSKVDDTNVTLTITSSANNHQFALGWQNVLADTRGGTGYDSIQKIYTLNGLGSYGSTTATTTAEGHLRVKGNLQVDGALFAPISLVTSGPVVINGESKALYHTATSTTVASTFPLASTTAVSIEPGIGQHGLVIRPTTGSCGSIMDIENQFGTDVFNITCAGVTSFNTLQVFNSGSTQNQLGGYLLDTTSVTTLQSGLTTRSAASFGSPYNSATPMVTFVKTASDDTGNFYRAGSIYADWVSAAAATRTGKLRLTLNDFNGEREVLSATSTGSASTLAVSLAMNGGNVGIGKATPSTALDVNGTASSTGLQVNGQGTMTGQLQVGTHLIIDRNAADANSGNLFSFQTRSSSGGNVASGQVLSRIRSLGLTAAGSQQLAAVIRAVVDGTPGSGDIPGRIEFLTALDGGTVSETSDANVRMVIKNDGKVGIGTTAPTSTVSIVGDPGSGILTVAKSMTDSATAPTSIASAFYQIIGKQEYTTNSYRLIGFGYNQNSTPPAYLGFQEINSAGNTAGDLIFGTRSVTTNTAPTERMRILANGNVGIGTTTPFAGGLSVQAISPGSNPIAIFATSSAVTSAPAASSSQTWIDFDGIAKVRDWFGNLAKYTSGAGMWQQTATSSAYSISKESEVDQVLTSYNFKFTEARTNPWVEVSGSIDNSGICPSGDDPTLKVVMTTTSTGQTNANGVHVITRSGSWDVPAAGERIGTCQAEDTNSSGTLYCEFDVGRAGLAFNYGATIFLNVVAADFDDTDCIVGLSNFKVFFH